MSQDRHSQWLRGVLDLLVLASVLRGESYGYELTRSLESAGFGPVQGGTLYPVLTRLQRAGLLAARWREGTAGPARKYYRITPAGEQTLRAAVADWGAFAASVGTLLRPDLMAPDPVEPAATREGESAASGTGSGATNSEATALR